MPPNQPLDVWAQIVAKAWQDTAFKKHLLATPVAVLKEAGVKVTPGIEIRVVENTDNVLHLTLPTKPAPGELADADLSGVAGGALSMRLVSNLAKVFGWNANQVGQILDAGGGKVTGGTSGGSGGDGADSGAE